MTKNRQKKQVKVLPNFELLVIFWRRSNVRLFGPKMAQNEPKLPSPQIAAELDTTRGLPP